VQRVRARLVAIFSSAVSVASMLSSEESGGSDSSSAFPSRAFAHCLRALVALSRREVAEEVVAETVTKPLAKTLLTQGRVDGNGGRGSYLGLQTALETLASQVMGALAVPLQACVATYPEIVRSNMEPADASSSSASDLSCSPVAMIPMDLIVKGVWLPVAALLTDKFPGMFSVGIASTLAHCYKSVEVFLSILDKQSEVIMSSSGRTGSGILTHPAVKAFHENWKLDLYLQVHLIIKAYFDILRGVISFSLSTSINSSQRKFYISHTYPLYCHHSDSSYVDTINPYSNLTLISTIYIYSFERRKYLDGWIGLVS
jgi:hypothetical protein